jgi:hypothetical protein
MGSEDADAEPTRPEELPKADLGRCRTPRCRLGWLYYQRADEGGSEDDCYTAVKCRSEEHNGT